MADPSVKKQLKTDGLSGACDKFKMNVLTKNLLVCMIENGRYHIFESVIGAFSTIMSAHRGEVVCEVTTAKVRFLRQPNEMPRWNAVDFALGGKRLTSLSGPDNWLVKRILWKFPATTNWAKGFAQ